MKKLLCALLLLTGFQVNAGLFHCTWNFEDFTADDLATRQVTIQTIARYGVNTNTPAIITGDLRSYKTSTNTSLTVSNLVNGRSYRVSFYGPLTPWGTNNVTVITNNFAADVSGLVNAVDYLNVPTQTDANASAYSQAQSDGRFLRRTNDTGTNMSFKGTLKFPDNATSGYFWKATNANGAGAWSAIPGGGDLLAANNLSDVANAATARDNLGLEIGADVLAYNANVSLLGQTITESELSLSDVTTADVSTTKHGFAPKGDGDTSKFLNANGAYSVPAGGGGSGISVTNGSGTNTVLFTHDNDPDATIGAALMIKPLEKRTTPGGSMTAYVIEPPYTNTGFLGRFKLVVGVATNSFGDLRPDITHNYGYNFAGNGSTGLAAIDTNEPSWLDTRESRWQNGVGLSQTEIWHSFGTPYTDYGTNTGFRYMGFNLNWNTTSRTYSSSDGNITIDSFYFGVPAVGTTPGNGLPAITFAKSRTNSMLQTLNQQSQISFSGNTHPDGQFLIDAEGQLLAGRYQYGMSAFGSPTSAKSNAIVLMPGTSLAGASPMILLGQTNGYAGFRWNVLSNRLEHSINAGGVATASLFWKPFNAFSEGWKSTYLSTSLSSTAGDYRELGYVTNHSGGNLSAMVVLTVVGYNNADIARYQVPLTTADGQSSTWKECIPITRGLNTAAPRIAVDVRGLDFKSALFRLRQLGSTTENNIRVTIELYGQSNGNSSPTGTDWVDQSANTGSGASVASLFRQTALTQVLGKVGIGTNNPSDTLQVFGGITALNLTNATTTSAFVYANADGGYGEATTANFIASAGGTPNGAKVLRDDWTWVALAGGGDALVANPLSQFAATTSLQLAGVISDETGSGAAVFGTSPTLTTPNIGVASGTSLTLSSLTSGRVPFATTAGLLTDDAGFTFNGSTDTLAVRHGIATTNIFDSEGYTRFAANGDGDAVGATELWDGNQKRIQITRGFSDPDPFGFIRFNDHAGDPVLIVTNGFVEAVTGHKFKGDGSILTGDDEDYGAGWNGDSTFPTKNEVYDKIETLGGGSVDDTAFASSWNGVTTTAPSKNVVYDWGHIHDSDDDGKVDVLDIATESLVKVNSGGVVSAATFADRTLLGMAKGYVTSDQVTASGTAVNATSLSFSIAANEVWSVEFYVGLTAEAAGANVKFAIDVPASATVGAQVRGSTASSLITADATLSGGVMNVSNGSAIIAALIQNASTAGTVQLQFASGDGINDATIKGGQTYFVARRLN